MLIQYFQGTDEWYENVAKSKPAKNKPWYHVSSTWSR